MKKVTDFLAGNIVVVKTVENMAVTGSNHTIVEKGWCFAITAIL